MWQRYGGISRYIIEMMTRIGSMNGINVKILSPFYINKYLRNVDKKLVKGVNIPIIPKTNKIFRCLNTVVSKIELNRNIPHILHETYYNRYDIAPTETKKVITVYDMIDELFPKNSKSDSRIAIVKIIAIQRADHIICISEKTKKDLIEILNVESSRISVIYLGYAKKQTLLNGKEINIDSPFILYVGMREGYKNFERLLKAYIRNNQLHNNYKLVCFGGPKFGRNYYKELMCSKNIENNILHISGSDIILEQLYKKATVFVYPSLYEGFGIPPLEAMNNGCPVICSDQGAIPEIVGEAAEYFNPYEVDSISNAIESVLNDSGRLKHLKNIGYERIKKYSWEKCANETYGVYKHLLDK